MESDRLRPIIIKLHERLSKEDRKRLHFYLGNDVPRPIREDSTLSGTLDLMDSLFDQDKINDENFTFLINAFYGIRCYDAVKLLKEHLEKKQSKGLNRPIERLSSIMPNIIREQMADQVEDTPLPEHLLINQQNVCGNNNTVIDSNNTHIDRMPMRVSDIVTVYSKPKRKQMLNSSFISLWKCLLLFALLSIVGFGILSAFSVWHSIRIEQLKRKNNQSAEFIEQLRIKNSQSIEFIEELKVKNNQSTELIRQLKHLLEQLEYQGSSTFKLNIPLNATWIQDGITIAGVGEEGDELNQLYHPLGFYVDNDRTIYVADSDNNRIMQWTYNAASGQVVAGGNGPGNETNQLKNPSHVIVDKDRNHLIICDQGNRRVVRWSRQYSTNGQTIMSNIDCSDLAMDNNGYLYVSEPQKHRVSRWKMNDASRTLLVAGGNGKGNRSNQLDTPASIFVDDDYSVYVSDWRNHRVMKWIKGAKEGMVVAGGQGQGDGLTQLSYPQGLIVDQLGTVYVADCHNHRVTRWYKGAKQGSTIIGGKGKGKQANQFDYPFGLSCDRQGNLYVIDIGNDRVQKFNIDRR